MNKFTKASIATGAGIVLLLGGAGTLAYWNDSAAAGAGSITAGTLGITPDGLGAWSEGTTALSDGGDALPTGFLVVPGDTITYERTFAIAATGTNLKADLSVNTDDIVNPWGDDVDLAVTYYLDGVEMTSSQITSADDTKSVRAVVTLTFAFDATEQSTVTTDLPPVNNDTQGSTLNLSSLEVVLTQVA